MLWDASLDSERIKQEFLQGYFGNAAGPINQFLELLHDKVENDNTHGYFSEGIDVIIQPHRLYADGETPHFMTKEIIAESRRLFEEARASVTDPAIHKRLEQAEFSLDYLEHMRAVYRAQGSNEAAKAKALGGIRALAERSRTLGYHEWSSGPPGTMERRLNEIEAKLTKQKWKQN